MTKTMIEKNNEKRENEYEHVVHEDKSKFNTWGSRIYKYVRREN